MQSDKDSKTVITDDASTAAATTAADDSSSRLATSTPELLSSQGSEQHATKSVATDSPPHLREVISGSADADRAYHISQKQPRHLSNTKLSETSNMQDKAKSAPSSSEHASFPAGTAASEELREPQQTSLGQIPDKHTEFQRKIVVHNSIRTKSQFAGSTHNHSNMSSGISNSQSGNFSNNQSNADNKATDSSNSSSQSDSGYGLLFDSYTPGHSGTFSSAVARAGGQSGSLSHQSIDSSNDATGIHSVDNSSLSLDSSFEASSCSGSDSTASQATDSDNWLPSLDSSDSSDRGQAGGHGLRGHGPLPSAVRAPRSTFRGRGRASFRGVATGRGGVMSRGRGAGRRGMTSWGAPCIQWESATGLPGPRTPCRPWPLWRGGSLPHPTDQCA